MHYQATKYYTIDSGIALLIAFLINVAVVCTFARQFYDEQCATASVASACFIGDSIDPSQPNYGTCDADGTGLCQEIGLSDAAEALKGTIGSSAKYIWAVGLLVRDGTCQHIVFSFLVSFRCVLYVRASGVRSARKAAPYRGQQIKSETPLESTLDSEWRHVHLEL